MGLFSKTKTQDVIGTIIPQAIAAVDTRTKPVTDRGDFDEFLERIKQNDILQWALSQSLTRNGCVKSSPM